MPCRTTEPREYFLLGAKVDAPIPPESFEGFEYLGCDLADETMTSSLLNCGPWMGSLQPLTLRLNEVGLLSVDDALQAQRLLPAEWGADEPHASASVWAVFARAHPVEGSGIDDEHR